MSDALLVQRGDGFQSWTLNRPTARNALDPALVAALTAAVESADQRSDCRVVVLRGNGPSFCAGADLRHLASFSQMGDTPLPFLRTIIDLTMRMEASNTVFVAALHGHAIAGGIELALACDLVVAAEDTWIGDGHAKRNLMPGGGASYRMLKKLGPGFATRLALTGEPLRASELAHTGWISRVVPLSELDAAVDAEVALLLAAEPAAQISYKRLLRESGWADAEVALTHELDAFDRHWASHDVPEHLDRFLKTHRKHVPS